MLTHRMGTWTFLSCSMGQSKSHGKGVRNRNRPFFVFCDWKQIAINCDLKEHIISYLSGWRVCTRLSCILLKALMKVLAKTQSHLEAQWQCTYSEAHLGVRQIYSFVAVNARTLVSCSAPRCYPPSFSNGLLQQDPPPSQQLAPSVPAMQREVCWRDGVYIM